MNIAEITPNTEQRNILVRAVRLKQRLKFLIRILSSSLILPSEHRKGIDRDLLLTQQARSLQASITKIRSQLKQHSDLIYKFYKTKFYQSETDQAKQHFIDKFNWLNKKQSAHIKNKTKRNRKSYQRYKLRKSRQHMILIKENILNKSDYHLNDDHYAVLGKRLNFVPTPNWSKSTREHEILNLTKHIRALEWHSFFNGENPPQKPDSNLPNKLKIPKFNRPQSEMVNKKIIAFTEMAKTKLRNLGHKVSQNFKTKNNLKDNLRKALNDLRTEVTHKRIVICKSDKDGKIIILNYEDYDKIMKRELEKFELLPINNFKLTANEIRFHTESLIIKLHQLDAIDDDLLFHTVGIRYKKETIPVDDDKNNSRRYTRVTGPSAKHFLNQEPAYSYPLFKTHKIIPTDLGKISVHDIPVRLLQSAGNITTSRVTTFLESVLHPVSVRYCGLWVNEYCRDSKAYLEDLASWKDSLHLGNNNISKQTVYISTADVQALYPSIPREILVKSLTSALNTCSDYTKTIKTTLINLIIYCLNNVILQYQDSFYKQNKGIVTGDNHSVSIANISLHFIIRPISKILNKAVIFKRYIDDIIWITNAQQTNLLIQDSLSTTFKNNGLKLSFQTINTDLQGNTLEFLDVNHVVDPNSTAGFYTTDFTKPTATNSLFLNGGSFHPMSIFKGILYGEAVRLRRLNERDSNYKYSVERLTEKCLKSGFPTKLVQKGRDLVLKWKNRFKPDTKNDKPTHKFNNIVWASPLKQLIKLNHIEKSLSPFSTIVYKRPPTLATILCNFKKLSLTQEQTNIQGCRPCGRCSLCGNRSLKDGSRPVCAVASSNQITSSSNQSKYKIKQNISCQDIGIYVVNCRICNQQYVGQTITSFATRWAQHRSNWKHGTDNEKNDKASLRLHYSNNHKHKLGTSINDNYTIKFIEIPENPANLDFLESRWIARLDTKININATVLNLY